MTKIEELIKKLCPNGVEYKELCEVCNYIGAGGDLPLKYKKGQKEPSKEFPYPIYSNGTDDSSIYGYTDNYKINDNAITVSARGTIGYHTIRKAKFTPIVRLIVLMPNQNILTIKYLNYILDIIKLEPSGGSIPQLTIPNIKKIQISLPPIEVQEEIVRILDKFSALEAELEAELEARKKQYTYYRDSLLSFNDDTTNSTNITWKTLGEIGTRNQGINITAGKMKTLDCNGDVRVFAGGNTIADVEYKDIPNDNIIKLPSIIVKSRGYIGFEYYDKPFTHKNEIWSYTICNNSIIQKFVYYYLITQSDKLQKLARSKSVKIPQLSTPDTDNLLIPIPPIAEQECIVAILDKFDALVNDLTNGLPAEIKARRQQYEYYRDKLLNFPKIQ